MHTAGQTWRHGMLCPDYQFPPVETKVLVTRATSAVPSPDTGRRTTISRTRNGA
ncbi:hypothetical protein ABT354_35810 [Streptomyces sp. NPDC000594]|uniref:hypothetical protein n=1 Tax=Streptomyces sp. NPDC000594 TaxID=3154261 RepID=UPI003318870D